MRIPRNSLLFLPFLTIALLPAATPSDLGGSLTPVGAVRAGNANGLIPAWTGGITEMPAGYQPGQQHIDPFAADQLRAIVTNSNVEEHAEYLTPGHRAMLETYPDSFRLRIFPTRRSASYPQHVYDAIRQNAERAQLVEGGAGVTGAILGIPFPIPTRAEEVIWNHLMRFRGDSLTRHVTQAAPNRRGNFTLVEFYDELLFRHAIDPGSGSDQSNVLLYLKQTVTAPARLSGSILLVHETLDQIREPRRAWTYNVGQRRVRRAPQVAYDNPGTASDGMRTSDQFDMFNGALDRYDWKLHGRREFYVPYNAYELHSDQVKVEDIIKPLHINPDLSRYELHRVWVVEATLKDGTRHIYPRRVFYVDEDSWQILMVEQYDARGQLWRISEGFPINYYDVPCFWTTMEVHTDLQTGRYLAIGMDNQTQPYDFTRRFSPSNFTPASLSRSGVR